VLRKGKLLEIRLSPEATPEGGEGKTVERENQCLFCNVDQDRIIAENELAFAIRDGFPVTELHSLIIPRRHVVDYFGLTKEELFACNDLLLLVKEGILTSDPSVRGFNIGANSGLVAGQSIFHCHIHLIPRREGDVPNPKGGIRHVIPGKGTY
jgi:diadenosine tetraphosphate (Ap4A) HIT family hydrolase